MNITQSFNIYLVGLPTSGKTTIGKILAKLTRKQFYDSDQYLIQKTGVSIKTIFDLEGEVGFREREKKVLEELTSYNNIVLATGGGSILKLENRLLLKSTGLVVYLEAKPEFLFTRMLKDHSRPLLEGDDPLKKLHHLFKERVSLYQEVSHIVYSIQKSNISSYRCAEEIIQLIKDRKNDDCQ